MQVELKDLQARVGITFVYVTHDQEEALTMSDRIGVMDYGRLLQVGEPASIYDHPTSRFVAGFIGDINLVDATVIGAKEVRLGNGHGLPVATQRSAGSFVTLALRPERLELYDPDEAIPDSHFRLAGKVTRKLYYGDAFYYDVEVGLDHPLEVKEENRPGVGTYELGDDAVVVWDPSATNIVMD
jgi:spermidine/putrescine transport system ATP-binding protein